MDGLKAIAAQGESPEITTEAGLRCLAAIRKTADKSGRIVCTIFETLPPRDRKNADYYKRTHLPISLETIEQKLQAGKYDNMTQVESDLKRMVQNVKEQSPKKSQAFEDAERVRKAVSNYMVKHNPAYLDPNYSAFSTPFPNSEDEEMPDANDENPEDDNDDDAADTADSDAGADADADAADDDKMDVDEDTENNNVAAKDDNSEGAAEDEADDSTLPKRRGRRPRTSTAAAPAPSVSSTRHSARVSASTPTPSVGRKASLSSTPQATKKTDDELLSLTSYKGLTFQEAQEKIVEELLRKEEDGYDGPYFEAFINLPTRELKDYYQVIAEPLSLRKFKKNVVGFQSKKLITGITPYRTWKAFEEKASLLWENAYYYNEEGSDIYGLAKELENFFKKHLKDAKAHVSEPTPAPSSTKVIIKSRTAAAATPPSKIILHAGRSRRDDTLEEPSPQKAKDQPAKSAPTIVSARDKSKAKTATAGPAPGSAAADGDEDEDEDEGAGQEAAVPVHKKEDTDEAAADAQQGDKLEDEATPEPEVEEPPAKRLKPVTHTRYAGRTTADAILQKVAFQTINVHNKPHQLLISAHATEMRQHHSYHLDGTFLNQKMRIVPTTPPGLFENRFVRFYVTADKVPLEPSNYAADPDKFYFETILHRGVNTMEVHYIAGPPAGVDLPDEARYEVEVITASFNVYPGF